MYASQHTHAHTHIQTDMPTKVDQKCQLDTVVQVTQEANEVSQVHHRVNQPEGEPIWIKESRAENMNEVGKNKEMRSCSIQARMFKVEAMAEKPRARDL